MFLSWLIETTDGMNVFVITGIVIAIGMGLFMLPPVPGIPIYTTGGILLLSAGKKSMGLVGSIIYACVVSMTIKLLGSAMQQKLIGGTLGSNTKVRQAVGINSEFIRATRVIFEDRGFTARKVAILVGGPDWPVSVLCGK